jgi:hypothetical protein
MTAPFLGQYWLYFSCLWHFLHCAKGTSIFQQPTNAISHTGSFCSAGVFANLGFIFASFPTITCAKGTILSDCIHPGFSLVLKALLP